MVYYGIRGSALFGVLATNLTGFITFALPEKDSALLLVTTPADKFTEQFVSLFIEGKFITILSLSVVYCTFLVRLYHTWPILKIKVWPPLARCHN